MAENGLINNSIITKEALLLRRNSNAFISNVNRVYEDKFAVNGSKIGSTISVRLPNDYVVVDGGDITNKIQGTQERTIPFAIDKQKTVPMSFSRTERTLNIDDFSARYIEPAVNSLTGSIAKDLVKVMNETSNIAPEFIKDSGGNNVLVTPSVATWLNAGSILTDSNAPISGRFAVLSPTSNARAVASMATMFNPAPVISGQVIKGAMSATNLGIDNWYSDQTIGIHTVGSYDSKATFVSASSPESGIQPSISAVTSPRYTVLTVSAINGTLNDGDKIKLSGIFGVNHVTKDSTGKEKTFSVVGDVASGATTIKITPALVGPDSNGNSVAYQTVFTNPTSETTVELIMPAGIQYRANYVLHRDAITLASVLMENIANGVIESSQETLDSVSMRVLTFLDGFASAEITRLDILYGVLMLRPDFAVCVPDVL